MNDATGNTVRKSISLDAIRDHDLIVWLDQQDNTSEVIRAALRQYMGQPSASDVLNAIGALTSGMEEVLRTLRSVDIKHETVKKSDDVSIAARNLDKMIGNWR